MSDHSHDYVPDRGLHHGRAEHDKSHGTEASPDLGNEVPRVNLGLEALRSHFRTTDPDKIMAIVADMSQRELQVRIMDLSRGIGDHLSRVGRCFPPNPSISCDSCGCHGCFA